MCSFCFILIPLAPAGGCAGRWISPFGEYVLLGHRSAGEDSRTTRAVIDRQMSLPQNAVGKSL